MSTSATRSGRGGSTARVRPTGKLAPKKKPQAGRLSEKQKLVQASVQRRQQVQERVFGWQEQLFSAEQVAATVLVQAAAWLQPATYDEVVEERFVQSLCGYPLCARAPAPQPRLHISLSRRKVFDQSELAKYCSPACLQKSRYYAMQLLDDPVWARDMDAPQTPVHVIPMNQAFTDAVKQHQGAQARSQHTIRHEYVQQRIAAMPMSSAMPTQQENTTATAPDFLQSLQIIEKESSIESSDLLTAMTPMHDAIEGYRIEHRPATATTRQPSTIVLDNRATVATASASTSAPPNETDADDEEALIDEAMETMMMLKRMHLDEPNVPQQPQNEDPAPNTPPSHENDAQMDREPTLVPPTSTSTSTSTSMPSSTKSSSSPSASSSSSSASASASIPPASQPSTSTATQNSNIIHVTTKAPAPDTANAAAKKKKKKNEPIMSLFGKIWTVLDRMTTRATRQYLAALQDPSLSVQGDHADEDDDLDPVQREENDLRSQIFSEKILEMYNSVVRAQLGVVMELEKDMMRLIRTFRFADASMVVLDGQQTYMMTLILVKTVAMDLFEDDNGKKQALETCCQHIGQSTDMIDACIRVLRIAST